jgi:hypothetical protein
MGDIVHSKASVVARLVGFIGGNVNVLSVVSASKGHESNTG